MTKQLFIIYDNDWIQSATLLHDLLGNHPNIKASLYKKSESNKIKFVSREKCLYIGQDCSSSLNFDDNYNELGIHVGYMGAKAWIRCSKYEWNVAQLKKFENVLEIFTNKYKTKKEFETYKNEDKKCINVEFLIGDEPWPGNAIERLKDKNISNKGFRRFNDINYAVLNQVYGGGHYFRFIKKVAGDEPRIRKYQYMIGIYKFYEDYLNDFLGISKSGETPNNEDSTPESEKKK